MALQITCAKKIYGKKRLIDADAAARPGVVTTKAGYMIHHA
jgi:hypothetical protein